MVQTLGRDSFFWAVGRMCALHRIPFDAELLLRRFPPPYDTVSLQQAALAYDFKVALETLPVEDIHPAVFPVLAILKPKTQETQSLTDLTTATDDTSAEQAQQPPLLDYNIAIVLKADRERVLILVPGEAAPQTITVAEYNELATGQNLSANELRNAFGVVPQETMLRPKLTSFGTIYENEQRAARFSAR